MIAKDCPANYQARRIAANIAKLPVVIVNFRLAPTTASF